MNHVDVQVVGGPSVYLFRPLTPRANEWLHEHTDPENSQWFGGALVVEWRFYADLVVGLQSHEFFVSR